MAETNYAPDPRTNPLFWPPSRGFGSGSGGGAGLSGTGSPEGVVTAKVGTLYTRLDTGGLWNKVTGTGNTGWNELIA